MCFIATATTSEHAEQCITARRQRGNHLLVGQDLALVVQWFLWHKCENDFKIIIEIIYHLFVLILDWCCYQLIYSRPKYFSGIGSKNINGTFFSLVPSWLKKKSSNFRRCPWSWTTAFRPKLSGGVFFIPTQSLAPPLAGGWFVLHCHSKNNL